MLNQDACMALAQEYEGRPLEELPSEPWDGCWPVVDRHLHLTGEVVDASSEDWLLVEDGQAAIWRTEAEAAGWVIAGDEARRG